MVSAVVEATSQTMSKRDPLRTHMDIIYRQVHLWQLGSPCYNQDGNNQAQHLQTRK